ncbi:hypothetical protein GCM10027343_19350 [Noviherbaspirillum agri]
MHATRPIKRTDLTIDYCNGNGNTTEAREMIEACSFPMFVLALRDEPVRYILSWKVLFTNAFNHLG